MDTHINRSELIDSWERQRVMVVGCPGLVGWTVQRIVTNGQTASFVVEFSGGMRIPALVSDVTVVDDICIPDVPNPSCAAIIQFPKPFRVHAIGDAV